MARADLCRLCSTIAVVFAIGCAGMGTEGGDPMEIELDAFSGRPNPKWVASPARAASISRGLSSLPDAPARPEPDHLGYRGFIVRQGGMHARVYGGHVIVSANGTTRTFIDTSGLEAQLTADARERGFGDIIRKQG